MGIKKKHVPGNSCCNPAAPPCSICSDDPPVDFQVVFSGVANSGVPNWECTLCSNLNGTHVLTAQSTCYWLKRIDNLGTSVFSQAECEGPLDIKLLLLSLGGGNYRIRVYLEAVSGSGGIVVDFKYDQGSVFVCRDISGLSLSVLSDVDLMCRETTATCTVTAI